MWGWSGLTGHRASPGAASCLRETSVLPKELESLGDYLVTHLQCKAVTVDPPDLPVCAHMPGHGCGHPGQAAT